MFEIAAGIPSYNEQDSISFVTRQIDRGLNEYFPGRKSVIVNMDSCSTDGTVERFLGTPTGSEKKVLMEEGVRGKGNMVRMFLDFINEENTGNALMADADLRSITPEWVRLLLEPVLGGYDYCTPLYSRHKYDGTITNMLVYPIVYGLYGRDIRQPIGGDFSFSKKAADCWLDAEWLESTRFYGVDNFMTTTAVCNGLKICQAKLGAKIHKASGPKLGQMFIQVVETLFENACRCFDFISRVKKVTRPEIFGNREEAPEEVVLDGEGIRKKAADGIAREFDSYATLLPPGMTEKIKSRVTARDWCEIVYSFLNRYKGLKQHEKRNLINALSPLYFARIHSFMEETLDADGKKAEELIMENAEIFFEKRGMFVEGSD